jgi:hypothetical protein
MAWISLTGAAPFKSGPVSGCYRSDVLCPEKPPPPGALAGEAPSPARSSRLQIIDPHTGNLSNHSAPCAQDIGGSRSGSRSAEGGVDSRRHDPFLWSQVSIARTYGQPVAFSNGRMPNDANGKIQIPHHSPDDGELLPILFSKDGSIRMGDQEQLRHHCTYSTKMTGPCSSAQGSRERAFVDKHRAVLMIHLMHAGIEHEVRSRSPANFQIVTERLRIFRVVLRGPKLNGVDEN